MRDIEQTAIFLWLIVFFGYCPVVSNYLRNMLTLGEVETDTSSVSRGGALSGATFGSTRSLGTSDGNIVFQLAYVHGIAVIVRELLIRFLCYFGHHSY